jgi:large conductance mechanosensitive channel
MHIRAGRGPRRRTAHARQQERGAMTGFKNFVMRGNLVELAVAVVIGTQFSSLVKQFVSSFIDPLLSLVGGTPDLGKLVLHVGKATFT